MMAIREGNTITVARDFVTAATGSITKGYKVVIHGAEQYTFIVEAETGDNAASMALRLLGIRSGVTFQSL